MSLRHRALGAWLALSLVISVMAAGRATAAPGPAGHYVPYYVVGRASDGEPEQLTSIADRLLGDAARTEELLWLNVGRLQPVGGRLSDNGKLRVGWYLVLPWDAVGSGVQHGVLPDKPPVAPATTPTPTRGGTPEAPPAPPQAGTAPASKAPRSGAPSPGTSTNGPQPSSTSLPNDRSTDCVASGTATNAGAVWAQMRLAASEAWKHSRGAGVTVAVVDSGVDDGVPALADRVLTGADLRSGTADGNVDCLGSGTALAGIVAGRSDDQGRTAGVAPDATILPLRIADTKASARPEDAATAIEVAVSAGAKVVTLGRLVDPRHPMVAAAVESAGRHDVVVVVSAPPAGADRGDVAPAEPVGVLTVGGVGAQNELTAAYAPNAVTVTAPGTNASSLGGGATAGSGTEYAAAFVAGVVALVRSSHPHLNAIQVVKRIASTADRMSATTPDPKYGWGMVNPAAAVTQVIAGEPTLESGGKNNGLLLIMLVGIGATVVLVTGLWRLVRRKRKDGEVTVEGPPIEDSFPKGSRESQGEAGGSMDSSR